ncbi:MAG: hypothetical protein A2270_10380 [Elusimicrobia bacterium RIFOXYA12_FULL_51_18]|nr:MAG: hypothetical protein A2270_10380 [Elusimicrobia bacterium RIFOXYA12_FULL_51_18]OGS29529.1 MAG: hypothetical protein A2218_00810 [Elusimicrobia bacterium RIFOXYA2_FULL_53_38]
MKEKRYKWSLIGICFVLAFIGIVGARDSRQEIATQKEKFEKLATKDDVDALDKKLGYISGAISKPTNSQNESHKKKIRGDLGEFIKELLGCEQRFRMGHGNGSDEESKKLRNQCSQLNKSIKDYLETNLDLSYSVNFDYPEVENLNPDHYKYRFENQAQSDSYRAQIRYLKKVINEQK